jgi:hypothetical protein
LLDHRAKAKRKQSINLGSLLLGRVKDVSSEYLLSPRSGRKKAPEIVHMVPVSFEFAGTITYINNVYIHVLFSSAWMSTHVHALHA